MRVPTPTATAGQRGWRRGQAYVEFALTALALVTLMFGIFELCLLFYDYDLVSFAASSAARWAMVHGANSGDPAAQSDVQNYVAGIVPGLDPTRLTVSAYWPQGNQPGNIVTVNVTYSFVFLPPFNNLGPLQLSVSTQSGIQN